MATPARHTLVTTKKQIPITKAGDSLALDVAVVKNRPLAVQVTSYLYLDSEQEPVRLDVRFNTLDNNATDASTIVLDAKGKSLKLTVGNSGYRRP